MNADDLDEADYFRSTDYDGTLVYGRRCGDGLYFIDFDSTKNPHSLSIPIDEWERPVEHISFQAAVALLVEQCTQNNQAVEEINTSNTIDGEKLEPGQFFIDLSDDAVGRRFEKPEDIVIFLTKSRYAWMDNSCSLHEEQVVPLTFHQAVLWLVQSLT
ncbi:MAG: hypothetical protein M0R80_25680 [Proteobacteria bacterium]|jgi:hypothetical protein|nr:hypothetical protein [Pseudomonadota bacterium]